MMSYFKLSLIVFCCFSIPDAGLCNKPPAFIHVEAYLTLSENLAPGSNVTWLSASDDDDTALRFSILGAPPSVNFQIKPLGPKSALVVLSSSLDRETIDQFTLTFQVTDGVNQPISQQCLVIVTGINDNPPQFVNLPSKVDLSENSPNGTLVYTVSATDRDTGTVFYELLNEQSVFHVHSTTGNITLIDNLVYVIKRIYVLHVMALDGGGLNATADLTVNILDSRSRPPYFVRLPYSVEVFENASIGTTVIQISAYDGATGLPGQIVYSIESGDFGFFAINSSSGWMTIRKPINYSIPDVRQRSGLLEIVVKAVSNSSLTNAEVSNWALVTVHLVDVNNHRPTFSQTVYNATIGTNSPPNTLLMFNPKIVVSDMDMGPNGRYVIYLQQNGRSFDIFNVLPDRGEEETAVTIYANNFDLLNFENTNAVVFQIMAQEYQSAENFSGMATVFVSLVKQNSRALVFSQDEYVVQLSENPQLGQFVVKVTAVFQVSDNSQRIMYSLIGSKASLFVVNSTTGDIFVGIDAANNSTLFDYETDPVFSIMVEARSGDLQAFAEITIYLSDKNDNPPVMISSVFYASLQENSASFLFPVFVKATDSDTTGRLVYSLVAGNFESSFAIDKYTGVVSVRIPVDFESLPQGSGGIINVTAMATNEDVPSLNSTALLIVIVEDVNDNAPHFLRRSYLSAIFENSTAGYIALNVTATDADATSPNNLIMYRIISGSLDNFYIDPDHGAITVAPNANFDSFTSQYVLTVQAADRGAGPLTDRCTVNITVIGDNNEPPLFIGGQRFMATVKDDAAIGTVILNMSSSYSNTRTKFRFQFLNSSFYGVDAGGRTVNDINYLMSLFALESSTGLVIVNSALSAQLAQMISISIIVMDQNAQTSYRQNNMAYLTVFVQRVKGGMPVFLPSAAPLTVHISETAVPGSVVARLVAVDPYQSPAPISYLITNSTDTAAKFEITDSNRLYGVITVKSSLSPVIAPTVSLTVTAAVVGNSSLSSSTMLIVIIDRIIGGLRWEFFPADVSVLENCTVGTSVTRVLAVETSSGRQLSEVLYFILTDVTGKFAFENNTGLLVTTGLLNAAVPAYYLLVEARLGSNRIVGDLTVRVQRVNGKKPKFDHQLYAAYTLTNATVGTELMTVRAADSDSDNLLTYYIDRRSGNASWLFGVDPITGSVFVSSSLTKVIGDLYFTVIADDRASPPLLGSTVVRVTVIDSSGNRLRIISPPENVTLYIMPNQPVGQFVAQIKSEYVGLENKRLVNYFLVTSFSNDWRFFTIDRQSGVITTAASINLTSKNAYYVQVQASDVSNALYSDFRNLTFVVHANDQTMPRFDRIHYPPPIKFSILEGISSVLVANIDFAERSKDGRDAVCYFIVDGSKEWTNRFLLEKFSGNLWLVVAIYQSETNYVDLVVKATDDCWSGYWEMDSSQHREWNISDDSMLLIRVFVLGKDVSQPRFSKQQFIAGILPDVQIEEPVLNLTEYTGQWGNGSNGAAYYTIGKDFRASNSLKAVISGLNRPPFKIGQSDGILRTNSYFQDDWIGSVNFDVYVGLSTQFVSDAANVTVYLLSNYQRVKVVFRGTPNEVSTIQDQFTDFLSNVTGTYVGVDAIHVHKSTAGISDPLQTAMFIYAVDQNSHIFDAISLKNMIDKVSVDQKDSFSRFNVTEVETVGDIIASQQSLSGTERSIIIAFAIIGTSLILLLFLFCIIVCLCQRKYKRKIKAANAIAAVSGRFNGDMNRLTVPAANACNSEGSNPVWHENFGGEFYNLSDSDSRNSCDDNSKGQNNSGSQEEFFDNSENSKSKKMHFYKVNGFSDSRPGSYNSDQSLNSSDQSRSRRLLPVNGASDANGISTLSKDLMAKSTNV